MNSAPDPKVAIVTGGGQGIGLAIARRLAADGMHVAIGDLNGDNAKQAANAIIAQGGRAIGYALDVGNMDQCRKFADQVTLDLGQVSVLINNAGIYPRGRSDELEAASFNAAVNVNLLGPIALCNALLPNMAARKWGRIVNISSYMSETAFGADSAYTMTKTGLLGLTRSLAAENGPNNITVNAVCPGNIITPMLEELAPKVEERDGLPPGGFFAQQAERIPMRRLGSPDEIASVISFLCGPDADYVTGQSIHVNGGLYYH